jgi:hypothetical protein
MATRIVSCPFGLAVTKSLATRAIIDTTGVAESELVFPSGPRKGEVWNERMLFAAYLGLHWALNERWAETK